MASAAFGSVFHFVFFIQVFMKFCWFSLSLSRSVNTHANIPFPSVHTKFDWHFKIIVPSHIQATKTDLPFPTERQCRLT